MQEALSRIHHILTITRPQCYLVAKHYSLVDDGFCRDGREVTMIKYHKS